MGGKGQSAVIVEFLKREYPDTKSDTFSAFIERCLLLGRKDSYIGMFTPYVWMFIQSYEKLREMIYQQHGISLLIQFEYSAFEEATVPVCTFVLNNAHINGLEGTYLRLVDFRGGMEVQRQKTLEAIADPTVPYRYTAAADNFSKIPGSPVAYWVGTKALKAFEYPTMNNVAEPRHGLATSNTDLFLKLWFEIDIGRSSLYDLTHPENYKWIPMNKGGSFRKWFGNNEWIINYENDGKEIKKYAADIYISSSRTIQNTKYYFQKSLTWSALTSGTFSVRTSDVGYIFGSGGYCAFVAPDMEKYILALMNNVVTRLFVSAVSPTLNYEVGHIKTIPVIKDKAKKAKVDELVTANISLSRSDWNAFETSWDFMTHPLIPTKEEKQDALRYQRARC
jgi:hypothetical protein